MLSEALRKNDMISRGFFKISQQIKKKGKIKQMWQNIGNYCIQVMSI